MDCLGVLGQFLCWVLVFVILSFFEEGIGNNLTMPSGPWGLESWVLGLGQGLVELGKVPFDLFWFSFRQMGNGSGVLNLFVCQANTL